MAGGHRESNGHFWPGAFACYDRHFFEIANVSTVKLGSNRTLAAPAKTLPKTSVFERASSIRVVQKVPSQSAGCRQQFKTATIIKMKDALK